MAASCHLASIKNVGSLGAISVARSGKGRECRLHPVIALPQIAPDTRSIDAFGNDLHSRAHWIPSFQAGFDQAQSEAARLQLIWPSQRLAGRHAVAGFDPASDRDAEKPKEARSAQIRDRFWQLSPYLSPHKIAIVDHFLWGFERNCVC